MNRRRTGPAALLSEGAQRGVELVVCQAPRPRLARWAAIVTIGLIVTVSDRAPAAAIEPREALPSYSIDRTGREPETLRTPPFSVTPVPNGAAGAAPASAMATTVAVLHWQGQQGAANLAHVSDVRVPNLLPAPVATVDASATQAAMAQVAATATASAAAEVARSVQGTIAASATASAVEAAALAATHEAGARAEATTAAQATRTARASASATRVSAAANATAIAAAVAATREAEVRAAAAAAPPPQPAPRHVSPLLLALVPILGGLGGVAYWRTRKEPFVLKANVASA